jgi:predicted nucleic acid-binding protein
MLVLPDTSVWARAHTPQIGAALAAAVREDRVVTTSPVTLELLRGARDRRDVAIRSRQYEAMPTVRMSESIEKRAGEVQEMLSWRGYHRGPSAVDLLAAAVAESISAELWHCDRHFELIAEITGQPTRQFAT